MSREVVAVQITAFKRDAIVKCFLDSSQLGARVISKRGEVKEFSDRSRGRLLFVAFNSSVDWLGYWVLTYPGNFPTDGRKVKRDISLFRKWLRREFDASYLWGLEFQTRGAPHINFLIDKFVPMDEAKHRWFEIVGSGDSKHLDQGVWVEFCNSDRAAGYMAAQYTAKKDFQKTVPTDYRSVGRFWGSTRGLVVPVREEILLIDEALPKVRTLRKFVDHSLKPRKVQPMRDDVKRKRKVKRKSNYFLHAGLQGFKSFKGAGVASRLIGEVKNVSGQKQG